MMCINKRSDWPNKSKRPCPEALLFPPSTASSYFKYKQQFIFPGGYLVKCKDHNNDDNINNRKYILNAVKKQTVK